MGFGGFGGLFGGFSPFGGIASLGASSGLPVITYNGKTINLPDPVTTCNYTTPAERRVNRSAGPVEILTMRTDVLVNLTIKSFRYNEYDLQRRLRSWWEWAKAGGDWQFSRYENHSVLTAIDGAAALGATTLTLDDATGVSEGDQYVLRDDFYVQVVKVTEVSGDVVTLDDPIDFAMPDGSTFRSEWCWPGKIIDVEYPVVEDPSVRWDFELEFLEAR